jgi:hypothetical protein
VAADSLTYKDPSNFYRCTSLDEHGQPVDVPTACGGDGQACCDSGEQGSQCGSGLTCNLGTYWRYTGILNPHQANTCFSWSCRHCIKETCALLCHADTVRCERCGMADQLCCPSFVPEMQHPVCGPGYGCDHQEDLIYKRTCKECGTKGSPCCWDTWAGFTCLNGLSCTGAIGGMMRTEPYEIVSQSEIPRR